MMDDLRQLFQRVRNIGTDHGSRRLFAAGAMPSTLFLLVLVPLKPWFPVLGPIKSAIGEIFDNFATSIFELFGVLFVGILRPLLFIKPPGDISPLVTFYNSLVGVFIGILLLGAPIYLAVSMLYPNSSKASVWRLAERMLAAVLILFALRPLFDAAVILTNESGRYLLGTDYSIELLGAGIKQLALAGGAQAFGVLIFAIVASFSTLITVGIFYVLLMMRMLLIYVVFALIPLLAALWIFDIGPMKYASQVSSLLFKATGLLLIFGIIISGVLATGDAIGGEQAAQALQSANGTNATGGQFQSVGNAGAGADGMSRGGAFQGVTTKPRVSEASIMTKIMGYLGSMWVAVILTYSAVGILIQTGSTSRRHRGAGTGQHIGRNKEGAGQYGGSGVVSETDDGGMVIQDAQTGRGVYMGENGQASMFGGTGSATGDASVTGDQLDDVSTAGMGGGTGTGTGSGVGGGGVGGGGGGSPIGGTTGGVDGDVFTDTDMEPMSITEKTATAASKPRDWAGAGIEAVGSAAGSRNFDRTESVLQRAGGGIKEHISRQGVKSAGYYGATFGGLAAVDENSGPIHRSLGRGVRSVGRAVKGGAKTYGKMFAEEDPVRATKIGLNGMRRSPIGDSRYSNATGELKEELRPDFGSSDDGGSSAGDGTADDDGSVDDGGSADRGGDSEPAGSTVAAERATVRQPITQQIDVSEYGVYDSPDAPYPRLDESELDELRDTLEDRYGEDAVESVYSTIDNVKNKDIHEGSEVAVQTNERLAKEALGFDGEIRNGGELAEEPSAGEIGVYRDLNTVSQEVIRENRGDKLTTFRGLAHGQNSSDAVADMLANPYRETVEIDTPTVSNHTTSPEEARKHADFLVSQNTDTDNIALAPDSLHMSNLTEGELQVKGGLTEIDADRVVSVPDREGESNALSETFAKLDEAGSLDSSQHETMKNTVQHLYDEGETISTEAGVDRLNNWADEFGQREEVGELQSARYSAMIDTMSVSPDTANDG